MLEGVVIRPPRGGEAKYILKCVLRTSRWSMSLVPDGEFNERQGELVTRLMASSKLLVADKDGLIKGFVIYDTPNTLHYVYVRDDARRQGVASDLVAAALPDAQHFQCSMKPRFRAPSGFQFVSGLISWLPQEGLSHAA